MVTVRACEAVMLDEDGVTVIVGVNFVLVLNFQRSLRYPEVELFPTPPKSQRLPLLSIKLLAP
jgi:hypothetical protein